MNAFLRNAIGGYDQTSLQNRHPDDKQLFAVGLPEELGVERATLGLLPTHQFGSFAATHLVREAQLYGAAPYCTHATQIVGEGIVFKKNNVGHMGSCPHQDWCLSSPRVSAATVKAFTQRHFGLWSVPDRDGYFEGAFLSYSPSVTKRLRTFEITSRGTQQWHRHLELLQEQLQDFQMALALALALNRTLILPPFYSRHLHGEPYRVGADYYFDLIRMQRVFPRIREASFLGRTFPEAATWPLKAPLPVFFIQLSQGEKYACRYYR